MPEHIIYLILAQCKRALKAEEKEQLEAWLAQNPVAEQEVSELRRLMAQHVLVDQYESIDVDRAWAKVREGLWKSPAKQHRRIPIFWRSVAAVAIPLFVVGMSIYFLHKNNKVESFADSQDRFWNQVKPVTAQAVLELENGEKIPLQENGKDTVTNKRGVAVGVKSNNTLKYDHIDAQKEEWNFLSTPVGGEYALVLSDGTKVYLNAGSRLRFPNKFVSKYKREVELVGEAYFEVTKDKMKPFYVKTSHSTIRVLGTEFNVSCYADDNFEQTTLARGLVEVEHDARKYTLIPGKQLESYATQGGASLKDVDVRLYTSWKDGIYRFNDMPLSTLAVKLERWYKVRFQFRDSACRRVRFTGAIAKSTDFRQFVNLIESTTNVRFSIQDNEIIISKK